MSVKRSRSRNSAPRHPSKAVGAPLFAADPVMGEKEARRVVRLLDAEQSWIVRTPIGFLPFAGKEAAFRHVGARVGCHFLELVHGRDDLSGISACRNEIRLMTAEAGK